MLKVGTEKLQPRWLGPCECTGNLAYKLELPETMRIHDAFHVSLLKPYYNKGRALPPPPPEVIDDESEWEVDRLLDHTAQETGNVEYLIRFLGSEYTDLQIVVPSSETELTAASRPYQSRIRYTHVCLRSTTI